MGYWIWEMGDEIWYMGYRIWEMGDEIWYLGYGIWDMGYGIRHTVHAYEALGVASTIFH